MQTGSGTAPAPCPTLVCNAGNLGGQVFNDYNGDGVRATLETIGVAGVAVGVYDRLNNIYTTTTDLDGLYQTPDHPGRQLPRARRVHQHSRHLRAGHAAGHQRGHGAVSENAPVCTAHLSLLNPADYSEANPLMAVTRFNRGDPLSAGVVPTFAYSAIPSVAGDPQPYQTSMFRPRRHSVHPEHHRCVPGRPGNTTNFAGSCGASRRGKWAASGAWPGRSSAGCCIWLRRCGVTRDGPLGPGGLYQWNRATNTTSPLVDVRTLGIDVGSIPSNAARGLTATLVVLKAGETHNFEHDTVESEVGKVGMGDLESSDDGNILYFTNLHKRTLHSYNLLTGAATTFTLPYSDTSPLPSATCINGVARPWATKVKEARCMWAWYAMPA